MPTKLRAMQRLSRHRQQWRDCDHLSTSRDLNPYVLYKHCSCVMFLCIVPKGFVNIKMPIIEKNACGWVDGWVIHSDYHEQIGKVYIFLFFPCWNFCHNWLSVPLTLHVQFLQLFLYWCGWVGDQSYPHFFWIIGSSTFTEPYIVSLICFFIILHQKCNRKILWDISAEWGCWHRHCWSPNLHTYMSDSWSVVRLQFFHITITTPFIELDHMCRLQC